MVAVRGPPPGKRKLRRGRVQAKLAKRAERQRVERLAAAPVAGIPEPVKLPAVIARHEQGMRFEREDLVVEEVPELENPNRTVYRARVNPSHRRLFSLESISRDQYDAAERYADLCEREAGGGGGGDMTGVHVPGWQQDPVSEAQVDVVTELRDLHRVLGPAARTLLDMLVLRDMLTKEIAATLARDPDKTLGQIQGVLTRCVEYWGIGDSSKRPQRRVIRRRARPPKAHQDVLAK